MSVLESTGALRLRWAWLRALSDTPIVVILASVFMGVMLFVMIDLYDRAYEFGSPEPENTDLTRRVLTVMLAPEY